MEKCKIFDGDCHIEKVVILGNHRRAGYGKV